MPATPITRSDRSLCRRPIRWITARLVPWCPAWLAPESIALSSFGFSIAAACAFHLAGAALWWLWVAVAMLVLRSLADCLDGEIARRRGLTSEHGMYLDILLDDLSFTVMAIGLGSAPFANFALIAITALIYLLNDLVVNFRIHLLHRHDIPAISPVEMCVLLIVCSALTWFSPEPLFHLRGYALGWFDVMALGGGLYGVIELAISARQLYVELVRAGR